jgi:hypothetical protein
MTATNQSYRERFLTRSRLIDYLGDLNTNTGAVTDTLYVTPHPGIIPGWEWLPPAALSCPNGLVLVSGPSRQAAFGAPFAIDIDDGDRMADGPYFGPFVESLTRRQTIAFILLRLGSFAVGVAKDEKLVSSKTGTRYVKGRHRKGGQSQRRFERNREVWIARLYDKLCKTALDRIGPFERDLDALAIGGDRHVLEDFTKRCGFADGLRRRLPNIEVPVDRPGLKSLERAVVTAWGCHVWEAEPSSENN